MLKFLSLRFALCAVAACLLLSACKDDALVSTTIIPGSDFLNGTFTDTFTVKTVTVKEDSLHAENLSRYLVGAMDDQVFGKSFAGVYTQLRLASYGLDFGDSAIVDSSILSMTYNDFYGDQTSLQSVRVYRLSEPIAINSDSTIFSDKTFTNDGVILGQKLNFTVNLDSSFHEGDTTLLPQLRIPLDTALAHDILHQDPTGAFANNTAFNTYLQGLYIEADSSTWSKGMMYFNLRNRESALTIYYHFPSSVTNVKKLKLYLDGTAINSNYFKHNYNGTPVQTALNNPTEDSLVYVQSMAGVKGKITIPNLQNLGNVILNKAELEITQRAVGTETFFETPLNMLVIAADSNGHNTFITDQTYNLGGLPTYGGSRTYVTIDGIVYVKYRVSIVGQLQLILNSKITNYGLYLVNANSNLRADRIAVGGGNTSDSYQMKLNLVYTKIP